MAKIATKFQRCPRYCRRHCWAGWSRFRCTGRSAPRSNVGSAGCWSRRCSPAGCHRARCWDRWWDRARHTRIGARGRRWPYSTANGSRRRARDITRAHWRYPHTRLRAGSGLIGNREGVARHCVTRSLPLGKQVRKNFFDLLANFPSPVRLLFVSATGASRRSHPARLGRGREKPSIYPTY